MADLEGNPCSQEELQALQIWARAHVHPMAHVRTAISQRNGYLLEVDAAGFQTSQWFGITPNDIIHAMLMAMSSMQLVA